VSLIWSKEMPNLSGSYLTGAALIEEEENQSARRREEKVRRADLTGRQKRVQSLPLGPKREKETRQSSVIQT